MLFHPGAVLLVVLVGSGGLRQRVVHQSRRPGHGRRAELAADPREVAGHTVPVVVGLHRPTPGRAEPGTKRSIVEQTADRFGHRLGPLRVHQESGLALPHGLGDAAAPAGDDRHAAGRRLGEGDPETLHPLLHQPRHAEVDLGDVVERGQVAVGHVGQEAHPVAHAELAGLLLQRLQLLARCRPPRTADRGSGSPGRASAWSAVSMPLWRASRATESSQRPSPRP